MAGDRWQVILEVRLAVPVHAGNLPPDLADRAPEVAAALGPNVTFTQQEVHHCIDARQVPALLQDIETRLWDGLKDYLGHPDFTGRYLRKKICREAVRVGGVNRQAARRFKSENLT